jgi:hypothetical protein
MGFESVRDALIRSADELGVYQLSTQRLPTGDDAAQQDIWHRRLKFYGRACWTTPILAAEYGLTAEMAPSRQGGPHHAVVRHPANGPGTLDVATVVRAMTSAFVGPGDKMSVTHDWTTEDLRRFQQVG